MSRVVEYLCMNDVCRQKPGTRWHTFDIETRVGARLDAHRSQRQRGALESSTR